MAFNWYKEGLRVLPTPRVQIRGPVIEIADVTYEDSGVYVCVLRGHKEPTRNFTITVAGEERAVNQGESPSKHLLLPLPIVWGFLHSFPFM